MRGRAAPWIALAALLGLVVLAVFLAASLERVTLTEGSSFNERIEVRRLVGLGEMYKGPMRSIDYIFAYGPAGLIVLGVVIYTVSQFKTEIRRRRRGTLPLMLAVVTVMIVIAFVARLQMTGADEEPAVAAQQVEETVQPGEPADIVVAEQAEPDTPLDEAHATSLLLQVAFGLLALGAFAGLIIAAARLRAPKPKAPLLREPSISDSVDNALRKLRLGRDAAGVVEECYRDMVRAFAESSGVDPSPLTPREFAHSLASVGLGGEPLEELTALFELVRYGRRPDEPLAPRALRCMTQLRDSLQVAAAAANP